MRNKIAIHFTKTELGILESALTYYTAGGWIDSESDSRNKTMLNLYDMIRDANTLRGLKRKPKTVSKRAKESI
jgi:hypothetical protein